MLTAPIHNGSPFESHMLSGRSKFKSRELYASEKDSGINFLIARENPDLSKPGNVRKIAAGYFTVQCLSNRTAGTQSELVQAYRRRHSRRNLRHCESRVENNGCILGRCVCHLSLDLNWLAIWPDDTINIK